MKEGQGERKSASVATLPKRKSRTRRLSRRAHLAGVWSGLGEPNLRRMESALLARRPITTQTREETER
jgi:hypothetical protein